MRTLGRFGFVLATLLSIGLKAQAQINIYVFVFPDCPICKYYLPKLHQLADTYESRSCNFNYIVPSKYLSQKERNKFKHTLKRNCKLSNEYIYTESTDTFYTRFNAMITPEVFVVNNDNVLIYSGAVDDKYINVSSYKQQTEQLYLKDAIECCLNGRNITTKRTEPIGCLISR